MRKRRGGIRLSKIAGLTAIGVWCSPPRARPPTCRAPTTASSTAARKPAATTSANTGAASATSTSTTTASSSSPSSGSRTSPGKIADVDVLKKQRRARHRLRAHRRQWRPLRSPCRPASSARPVRRFPSTRSSTAGATCTCTRTAAASSPSSTLRGAEAQDPANAAGFGDLSVHEVAMSQQFNGLIYLSTTPRGCASSTLLVARSWRRARSSTTRPPRQQLLGRRRLHRRRRPGVRRGLRPRPGAVHLQAHARPGCGQAR